MCVCVWLFVFTTLTPRVGVPYQGDNAYKCEQCDKKVDTLKRCCFHKLPPTLVVHLKRFGLNFETFTKHKINSSCEFPMELDLWPYTDAYLDAKQDGGGASTSSHSLRREECLYELSGVLIHAGTADFGHYFSIIRDRNGSGKWFVFNDESVSEFDAAEMEDWCFGACRAVKWCIAHQPTPPRLNACVCCAGCLQAEGVVAQRQGGVRCVSATRSCCSTIAWTRRKPLAATSHPTLWHAARQRSPRMATLKPALPSQRPTAWCRRVRSSEPASALPASTRILSSLAVVLELVRVLELDQELELELELELALEPELAPTGASWFQRLPARCPRGYRQACGSTLQRAKKATRTWNVWSDSSTHRIAGSWSDWLRTWSQRWRVPTCCPARVLRRGHHWRSS